MQEKLREKIARLYPGEDVASIEALMPLVEIFRMEDCPVDGTFGTIRINRRVTCVSLERPWLDNKENVSCIPVDAYLMKLILSPTYGFTYEVQDVVDRKDILSHWGNWLTDSKGCVLTGEGFGIVAGKTRYPEGKRGITNSQNTFRKFIKELNGAEWCRLIIHEVPS